MQAGRTRLALAACAAAVLLGAWPAAARTAQYTRTRHPIVLAHGMAGFDTLFGVYEYWYGIPRALRGGGARVYVTQVSQFNSTESRCLQLVRQVERIVATSGARKVNLVGHSHGGIDARCVAAVRPDLVASVTTVGSPHGGAELADALVPFLEDGSIGEELLAMFGDFAGRMLGLLAGTAYPQDAVAAMESVSSAGMSEFNTRHPWGLPAERCGEGRPVESIRGRRIRFYSWSGTRVGTNYLDPMDVPFRLASMLYDEPTDGLVGRCSSHLGDVIRDDYPFNHLDEVNQMFGLIGSRGPNPRAIFRAHANRLQKAGL